MKFQEKLLDSFIAFEQDLDLLNPIHTDRKDALKRFEKQGFPSKKDESWKYTSLKSIIQKNYNLSSKSDKSVELRDVKNTSLMILILLRLFLLMEFIVLFYLKQLMMEWTYVFFLLLSQKRNTRAH